ncbi:MAG: 6,7-dimethyl-8-ribityllumazine synthase [Bacteroidetes bacterium]|nr:6,7-dimethyl-8-ribityllumazine synthase [Bacteroidota bacterium]
MASSAEQDLFDPAKLPDGSGMEIAVVTAEWNSEITHALRDACLYTLVECGVPESSITSIMVPGAFELPIGAKMLLEHRLPDAVICLGCVIKGETRHDDYIASAVAKGIMDVSLETDTPVIFGVLTTENEAQARDRAGGKHGNKGVEAAITAVKMVTLAMELIETSQTFELGDDLDDVFDEEGEDEDY